MNALETLEAARALWDKQNDQLCFEDPAPAATYGSADASWRSSNREASPGPEKLVGGTIGASPPSWRRASPPSRMRPPTGTSHSYGDGRATLGEEAAVAGGDSTT